MKKTIFLFITFLFALFTGCKESNNDENPYDKPFDSSKGVTVTGIGPKKGGLGTKVVVTGENFGNDPSIIDLYFNDKKALIIKAQDNALYAMVPKQPGDSSVIRVEILYNNKNDTTIGILKDTWFEYYIKAVVTTVAGQWNVQEKEPQDGPALDATFYRPAKLAVDDVGNVLVADDQDAKRIRFISTKENKMTTVLNTTVPWSCTFNEQFSHYYVMERNSGQRPILFYSLSKSSNYMDSEIFYDQRGADNQYIFGSYTACALAADDTYVYMMTQNGERFVRVHQIDKTVELIGSGIETGTYSHMVFNPVDRKIYLSLEASGRVMRFDPYHIPAGRTTPWITWTDMEWIIGTGVVSGTSKEGHGHDAQLGTLCGLGVDHEGNIYICDQKFHCVWKVDPLLNCTVFAGPPAGAPVSGYRDGKPEEALFNRPYDITATYDGLIYVADTYNFVVRCISIQ
ncbi:MAG: IPT/TIG domain-containing protein [Bacteroidales bacterium]|jgi:hypothetical protein|nr:IPT/TIG domain-containing protein [Bacteroidales bacterium]